MEKDFFEIQSEFISYIERASEPSRPNEDSEEHTHHDEIEIYNFIEGELFFSFEGECIKVSNGDVVIIANGKLHRPIVHKSPKYYRKRFLIKTDLFALMPSGALELQKLISAKGIILIKNGALKGSPIENTLSDIENALKKRTLYGDFHAMLLLSTFLIEAAETCGTGDAKTTAFFGGRAESIAKYVDSNITTPLDYKTISRKFNVSEKNLYKIIYQRLWICSSVSHCSTSQNLGL